jgi:hypothetical protein
MLLLRSKNGRLDITVRCPKCKGEADFFEPFEAVRDESAQEFSQLPKARTKRGDQFIVKFPRIFPWNCREHQHVSCSRKGYWGVVSCRECPCRRKHNLNWPKDAFYRVEVVGDVLWGYNREHFAGVREFIAAKDRNPSNNPGFWAHARIPSIFLQAGRRTAIVRAIDNFLKQT